MRKLIIDRFEGNYAVCENENENFINITLNKLPKGCKEGDCLIEENGIFKIDTNATIEKRNNLNSMMNSLYE